MAALVNAIIAAVVGALNAAIAALGAVVAGVVSVLPDLPALPSLPDAFVTAESWVAWFIPVGTIVDVLGFSLTVWVIWQLAQLILRWAKAIQ